MKPLSLAGPQSGQDIHSSIANLKKMFSVTGSADTFADFGAQLLELIHDFFNEHGGIHSSISMEDLAGLFSTIDLPETPRRVQAVLDEIKRTVVTHSVKVASPYYIGHMTSAVPCFMILLEMIMVSLNQNQVKIETAKASSFVEREFLSWIHRLVYRRPAGFYRHNIQNRRVSLGVVTSDGTLANLTALTVALAKAFPPDGNAFRGIRAEGLVCALQHYGFRRAVVLVSARGHYSIKKAGSLLGIGTEGVVAVPVRPGAHTMDPGKLQQTIDAIRREDVRCGLPTRIAAVIGIAGTTETGNVDNLEALAHIAAQCKAHYHVDAAWGGGALLMDGGPKLLQGIAQADSVTLDAHKLLYAPNAMGMCLFKNPRDSLHLYHTSNYIIRKGSVDQGRFTIEGSRPFAALKPWAAMKIMGAAGYRVVFDHARSLQNVLTRLISDDPQFELLNDPELFIISYRFVPRDLREQLAHCMCAPQENAAAITEINRMLNRLNTELHKTVREHDMSFVSRTVLESTRYAPRKIVVLRAITVNPLTTAEILEEILSGHRERGDRIWQRLRGSKHAPPVMLVPCRRQSRERRTGR